jgi:3'(2'), 5'-bisphosphate nucleotidase
MLNDLNALLPEVVEIAREAGRETLSVFAQDFDVTHKADRSPLTEADLRAHHVILKRLTALTPNVPILSEESAVVPYAERWRWEEFWLVDPLDGTREFVARSPEFTVNIALIRKGQPVLGVVHVPVQKISYFGARRTSPYPLPPQTGEGGKSVDPAFRQIEGEAAVVIHVAGQAHSPVRILGSRSHRGGSLEGLLARLGPYQLKPVGSSLKFCLVADGSADFYARFGPTCEWDTAAGQVVVECAGGHVVDRGGQPLRYNSREGLVNPDFFVYGDAQLGASALRG